MKYIYKPKGVCSSLIEFDINNEVISNVKIISGCNGNGKGISRLVEGMKAQDIINKCEGIKCGNKNTSCPDQLSLAIKESMEEKKCMM